MNDQKVTEYIIVRSSGSSSVLTDEVAGKLKEGFQPLGGVACDAAGGYAQAMVKCGIAVNLEASIPKQKSAKVESPREVGVRVIDSSKDSIFGD